MNGSKLSKLVRTEPVSKELGGRQKNKTKKSHTEERKEPYDALERREQKNKNKKQPEEKEATRKVKKGRKTLNRT